MAQLQSRSQRQHAPRLDNVLSKDDDWTGLSDAAARRKRQNRLNVRAYRKRRACTSNPPANIATVSHRAECHQIAVPCTNFAQPYLATDMSVTKSTSTLAFPLSSDHLITLVQLNVIRGSITNRQYIDSLTPPVSAPTNLHVFSIPLLSQLSAIPSTLHPTTLQCTIPHPHCIDIIPHPGIRNNLILALGHFDAEKLWLESAGGVFEALEDREVSSAVVWDRPWHWEGWELSEKFVKSWGWVLVGCEEVLERTNWWRGLRGEGEIVLDGGE